MDFSLSKEQKDIQQAAREFAGGEFDPQLALQLDRDERFPLDIWKKACLHGFAGLRIPEGLEGAGFGPLEQALVVEAFCRRESGIGAALALADLGTAFLLAFGTPEQQQSLFTRLLEGEALWAVQLPAAGALRTDNGLVAEKTAEGIVLRGSHRFLPLADCATHLMLYCAEDRKQPSRQKAFVVPTGLDDLRISRLGPCLGLRTLCWTELELVGVHLVEGGPEIGVTSVSLEKKLARELLVTSAAVGAGIARGCFDRALDYSRRREQFGRPIISFKALQNMLADMLLETRTAQLMTYRAAWDLANGQADEQSALTAKLIASRAAFRVAFDALQIHGGLGYMTESHIERFYRDAKGLELFLGSASQQRRGLLNGLPGNVKKR